MTFQDPANKRTICRRSLRTAGHADLCGRVVERRTRHHLTPRSRHTNKRVKVRFTRKELHNTVPLCAACHRQIHRTFTEKELEWGYKPVETLLSHPEISRFVRWIEDKPHGVIARSEAR